MDVNQRIHEWRGKCWHNWRSMGPNWGYRCGKDCGATSSLAWHPAYDTDPAAMLALIEVVRAKGYDIAINITVEGIYDIGLWKNSRCVAGIVGYEALTPDFAKAVIALIDSGENERANNKED